MRRAVPRPAVRLWAASLLLAAACGSPGAGEPGAGEGDSGPAGGAAEPAVQADAPFLPPGAFSLAERFRIDPGLRLEIPRDLDIDAAGNLYVLDFAPPTQVLKFDSAGRFVTRLEDRDEAGGQTRLVSAIELSVAPWNVILVLDRGQNTLQSFLTSGAFISSVELGSSVGLDVHALPAFGEFYLHKWDAVRRRSAVLRMRAPLDSLGTAYEVRIPPRLSVREEARGVHYHTAVDRHGRLYVAFWDGYPVRVLEPSGATARVIDLEREPVRKTAGEIATEEEQNLALLRERSPGVDEELILEAARPDSVHPLIEELAVDPAGRLWVRTNRPDAGGSTTPYDVFNEAGDFLARVDAPGSVEKTAFGGDGTMYVIAALEPDGPRRIVAYEVRLSEISRPGSDPPSSAP